MSREIKFRAWDKSKKQMELLDSLYELQRMNLSEAELANLIFMQFTGLLDKNGVEIYEGDIVKYYQPYLKTTHSHIVRWDNTWACFGLFEKNNEWCREMDWGKIRELEVIGNIYENPELLEVLK